MPGILHYLEAGIGTLSLMRSISGIERQVHPTAVYFLPSASGGKDETCISIRKHLERDWRNWGTSREWPRRSWRRNWTSAENILVESNAGNTAAQSISWSNSPSHYNESVRETGESHICFDFSFCAFSSYMEGTFPSECSRKKERVSWYWSSSLRCSSRYFFLWCLWGASGDW